MGKYSTVEGIKLKIEEYFEEFTFANFFTTTFEYGNIIYNFKIDNIRSSVFDIDKYGYHEDEREEDFKVIEKLINDLVNVVLKFIPINSFNIISVHLGNSEIAYIQTIEYDNNFTLNKNEKNFIVDYWIPF